MSTDDAPSAATGLSGALDTGILRTTQFAPFPENPPARDAAGTAAADELDALLDAHPAPAGEPLPTDLLDAVRAQGFARLGNDPGIGGRGLSPLAVFRLVEHVALRSVPVAQLIAAQAGIGAAALEPTLPPGPLRESLGARIAAGMLSGFSATEPGGRNNAWPATTATPTADGAHYLLRGEKLYGIGAPVADLLVTSATAGSGADRRQCVCFVDTAAPGLGLDRLEFLGSRGLPVGAVRLDDVPVPADHVLFSAPGSPGLPPEAPQLGVALKLGELYINAAPAVAIAKNCLRWTREFVATRSIDGRPLGERSQIRRFAELSLADVYALESVVRWAMADVEPTTRGLERGLLKNVTVRIAGRVVDRTMGVLGGRGVETAGSQGTRGGPLAPVERAYRDARMLRVMGNIDFRADHLVLREMLAGLDRHEDRGGPDPGSVPGNEAHLGAARESVRRFAAAARELSERAPDPAALEEHHQETVLLGRLAGELFTTCAVLARTGHLTGTGGTDAPTARALCAVYCTEAEHRIAGLWRRLAAEAGTDDTLERRSSGSRPDRPLSTLLGLGQAHLTDAEPETTAWPPTPVPSIST